MNVFLFLTLLAMSMIPAFFAAIAWGIVAGLLVFVAVLAMGYQLVRKQLSQ